MGWGQSCCVLSRCAAPQLLLVSTDLEAALFSSFYGVSCLIKSWPLVIHLVSISAPLPGGGVGVELKVPTSLPLVGSSGFSPALPAQGSG